MKQLIRLFCLVAAIASLGSCAREEVIPDEELAQIFRDAYLINSYVDDRRMKIDSLELYEPVFSRYGYTVEDVRYTIGNFSRRKSAKLSDVVEQAILMLEKESAYYKYEVGVLDTINNVARRHFTRTVYADSLIRVGRLKDTSRLQIRIPDVIPGEYRISFDYLVDSLDENFNVRALMWFERSDGSREDEYPSNFQRFKKESTSRTMIADTAARTLVMSLYRHREKLKRPDLTLYNLKVTYTPETQVAVDSLYLDQLRLQIFADEFFQAFAPDSVQLPLHGAGTR